MTSDAQVSEAQAALAADLEEDRRILDALRAAALRIAERDGTHDHAWALGHILAVISEMGSEITEQVAA